MGCSSSKETTAVSGFTERKGPDIMEEKRRTTLKTTKQSLTLNEDSADSDENALQEYNPLSERRVTETVELKLDRLHVRYACLSKKGRDPDALQKPNQDSYSHHVEFLDDSKSSSFLGVYDGHGPTGEKCSAYVRKELPKLLKSELEDNYSLTANIIQECLTQSHIQCNRALHAHPDIDDTYSGTTSCCVLLQPERVTIANVGDSRVILGTVRQNTDDTEDKTSSSWTALPLSKDQTPRRSDEASRIRKTGARILSFGQISKEPSDDDSIEDPPRVWAPDGNYPGTAFSRSLGDRVAKKYGVSAQPEVLPLTLSEKEKCLIIGSDGIWDVLSNQQVVDICQKHHGNPFEACQEIVQKSHEEWLKNDLCTSPDDPNASFDDMTVIVVMLGDVEDLTDSQKNAVHVHFDAATEEEGKESKPSKAQSSKRRIRQKTLKPVEEGPAHDVFFVGSVTSSSTPAPSAAEILKPDET